MLADCPPLSPTPTLKDAPQSLSFPGREQLPAVAMALVLCHFFSAGIALPDKAYCVDKAYYALQAAPHVHTKSCPAPSCLTHHRSMLQRLEHPGHKALLHGTALSPPEAWTAFL